MKHVFLLFALTFMTLFAFSQATGDTNEVTQNVVEEVSAIDTVTLETAVVTEEITKETEIIPEEAVTETVVTETVVAAQETGDSTMVSDSTAMTGATTGEVKKEKGWFAIFLETVILILILGAAAFIIGHMGYTIYKAKTFAAQDYSLENFRAIRKEKGLPSESTQDENRKCNDLLDDAYESWTDVEGSGSREIHNPKYMREIVRTGRMLREIAEIAPTDVDIINTLNEYKEVVSRNEARSFDGSWKLIWVGVGVAVVIALIMQSDYGNFFGALFSVGLIFLIPTGAYYLSSYTPQFLIDKRANRGGGNVSSGIVALAFGIMGSGVTVRTHYTDGTSEDDHSSHFIMAALGIFVLLIVAFTISIWSIVNYLRNYVLFF